MHENWRYRKENEEANERIMKVMMMQEQEEEKEEKLKEKEEVPAGTLDGYNIQNNVNFK
jgi:hypothetical protein